MILQTAGMVAALASALAWALGALLFRKVGERASPPAMNLAKSLLGLIFLGIAALGSGGGWPEPQGLLRLVASGIQIGRAHV